MTYPKILTAINVYEDYQHVLNTAIAFAEKHQAEQLDIITVIDDTASFIPASSDFQKEIETDAKQRIESIKSNITTKTPCHFYILQGGPNRSIADFAEQHQHHLAIIGSHSRHGWHRLLGSTAVGVINKVACDLLVVRLQNDQANQQAHEYHKILLATDMESDNQRLVEQTKAIAQRENGQIHPITVYHDPATISGIYGLTHETQTAIEEATAEKMKKWCQDQQILGKNSIIQKGSPAHTITKYASEHHYDLITIGNHQRGALGRFFIGSTANAVLQTAQQDVLVVKVDTAKIDS